MTNDEKRQAWIDAAVQWLEDTGEVYLYDGSECWQDADGVYWCLPGLDAIARKHATARDCVEAAVRGMKRT